MWCYGCAQKKRVRDARLKRYARLIPTNISALTSVNLGGREVDDGATQTIAQALSDNKVITKLNLSFGSFGAVGVRAIGTMLSCNTTLTRLNLMNVDWSPHCMAFLANGLSENCSLEDLCLGYNRINDADAVALSDGLQNNPELKKLWLMGNSITAEGTNALAALLSNDQLSLTTLDLERNSIGSEGAQALAVALCTNITLKKLCIGKNAIKANGAIALGDALRINQTLEALWADKNDIRDEGGMAIAKGLACNMGLSELHLDGNSIGLRGAQSMGKCLEKNKILKKLCLDDNDIGSRGAKELAAGLCQNNTLATISLADNSIENEGAKALYFTAKSFNSSILSICLNKNDIEDSLRLKMNLKLEMHKKSQVQGVQGREEKNRNKKSCSFPRQPQGLTRLIPQRSLLRCNPMPSSHSRSEMNAEEKSNSLKPTRRKWIEERINEGRSAMKDTMDSMRCASSVPLEYLEHCTDNFSDKRIKGKGSCGEVYLATDDLLRRKFVVKKLKLNACSRSDEKSLLQAKASFQREIEVFSRFQHRNIPRLFAYFLSSNIRDSQCLVFEYASNGSLQSFLEDDSKRAKLTWTVRIQISHDIARALQCMHLGEGGQVCYHMDVNPSNVCLKKDFTAMLTDCGSSKLVPTDDSSMTMSMMHTFGAKMRGTRGYICPEYAENIVLGREDAFCSSCDVFSLGIVLIDIFTGKLQMSEVDGKQVNHFDSYSLDGGSGKVLKAYTDPLAGKWRERHQDEFSALALRMIARRNDKRPNICQVASKLRSLSSSAKPWSHDKRNTVCYLFSDPLVWEDRIGMHPCSPRLDFYRELSLLKRVIHESCRDIKLEVRAASWQNLQEQARERCGCLHISCHGLEPAHIMLEDEVGGAYCISANKLSEMLRPFPEPFEFVFVAACHSEDIGRAFVQSGVKHVLSCELHSRLLDTAAADFAQCFYASLSTGYTIEAAYLSAKAHVSTGHNKQESNKYTLLPQGTDHDVPIFDADRIEWKDDPPNLVYEDNFSVHDGIGLEAHTHQVLFELLRANSRLITLLGGRKEQRIALARASGGYIRDRLGGGNTFFNNVIFLDGHIKDPMLSQQSQTFLCCLERKVKRSGTAIEIARGADQITAICDLLSPMRTLLILFGYEQEAALAHYLGVLFETVKHLSVVLTVSHPLGIQSAGIEEKIIHIQ